jgi:hypothetical protein
MSDSLVFSESISSDLNVSEFTKKKWVYAIDSQNGAYNNQVTIDTTSLSNSGAFPNWAEGFIVMPLVVSLSSANAASLPLGTTFADMSWGFKAGFWQMINSMSVSYNNGNIIQETSFLNVFASFRALTEWGWVDVQNDGASTGFYPDNAASWSFCNANTPTNNLQGNGQGICNNRNDPSLSAFIPVAFDSLLANTNAQNGTPILLSSAVSGLPQAGAAGLTTYSGACAQNVVLQNDASYNDGFLKRQFYTSYDPYQATGVNDPLNQTAINSASSLTTVSRSFKQTQANAGIINWTVTAKLRLKDLADFFSKMPLAKGGTFKFIINTNQASMQFTTTQPTINANGIITSTLPNASAIGTVVPGYPTLTLNSVNVQSGYTNPLMIASINNGQGCSALLADTYTLSVSIYKNTNANQQIAGVGAPQYTGGLTACRLYVPLYTFSPGAESQYFKALSERKKILYTDIFQTTLSGIVPGQFNFLVSNGLPNIQFVLLVPFLTAGANGTCGNTTVQTVSVAYAAGPPIVPLGYSSVTGGALYNTLFSPFSTAGGTPDPVCINQFQVQIANQSLFDENVYYDYELFLEHLRSSNQLNGDLITGMSSGLISEQSFSRGMRYYYADCSRELESDTGVSKSVQIRGNNASSVSINCMCFVGYKKMLEIDLRNGTVLAKSSS